jgi:hypothetical protein
MIPYLKFRSVFYVIPLLVTLSMGCSEDENVVQPPSGGGLVDVTFVVRDVDYIRNQFFYFVHPDPSLDDVQPAYDLDDILPDLANSPLEIWQSVEDHEVPALPGVIWANAFVDTMGDGGDLAAGAGDIAAGRPVPDEFGRRRFKRLNRYEDYDCLLDIEDIGKVVGFRLRRPAEDHRYLAVRYTSVRGDRIGGTYKDYGINDSEDDLILKLIKVAYARPEGPAGYTWRFMSRSWYDLGLTFITPQYFSVAVRDNLSAREDRTYPEGGDPNVPYLQIFGLDQYDPAGNRRPDGSIDIRPDLLDLASGILLMPSLTPFAPDSTSVGDWTDRQFSFTDSKYVAQWERSMRMYTEYLTPPAEDVHQYDIVVRLRYYVP